MRHGQRSCRRPASLTMRIIVGQGGATQDDVFCKDADDGEGL